MWRGRIKKPGDILSLVLVLATPKAGGLQRPVCRRECRFSNVDPRVGPRLQSVTCAGAALSFLCASSFTVRRGGLTMWPVRSFHLLSPHRRVLHAHVHAGLSRVGQRLKERLECNCGPACVICVCRPLNDAASSILMLCLCAV